MIHLKKLFSWLSKNRKDTQRLCLSCKSYIDPLLDTCPRCGKSLTALLGKDKIDVLKQQQKSINHNERGLNYMKQGKLDDAEEEIRKAIKINPNQSLAHSNLGIVLLQKSRIDDAIACFKHALKLNPHNQSASRYLEIAQDARNLLR